jgi:ABC-type Fe3+ transport system permease subunit
VSGQPAAPEANAPESAAPDPASPGSTPTGSEAAPAVTHEPADAPAATPGRSRRWWIAGIAIAVLVVVLLAPLASTDPDGLERVAEDQGFIGQATNLVSGLLGDYAIPGIGNETLSTILSGLLGIALVVGVLFLLGRLVARRRT